MVMYVSRASQILLGSAWNPKGVRLLLYAPLLATPALNKSE